MKLVHKKLDNKTVVFEQVKESMKKNFANLKASQQNKIKSNLIGVISRPGWNLHYREVEDNEI